MRPIRTFRLVALACLAGVTPAIAQSQGGVNIPFERMTLPNGLEVILAPDHAVPQVAVNIYYHVGSKNEVRGRTGFAHMFEHVMFTGSGHVPYGTHDRLTNGVGGTNNGSTNNDRTNYYEVVPSNYLESALWLESDRMGFLLDKLDEAKFKAQRDVVQNERRQRVDNQPYGRQFELLDYGIYPEGHPYGWPVVGYMADLQQATVDDVKDFFRVYYAPSNATMTIAGDFQPTAARALVMKYFGDIKAGARIARPAITMPVLTAEKRMTYEDRVQVPRLYFTWPTVGIDNPDATALRFLAQVIAGSRTARLTKALVYDKQSAAAVQAFYNDNENAGNFVLIVTPRPGNTLTQLEASTDEIIARLKADGPTSDELVKSKAGLEFDFIDSLQSNLGKSNILNDGLVFHGDAGYYKKEYERLKAVTPADVKRVANKYLSSNRVVVSIVPLGKPEMAAKPDVSSKVTVSADGGHYILGGK